MEQEEAERLILRASADVDSLYEILKRVEKGGVVTSATLRRHGVRMDQLAEGIDGVQVSVDAVEEGVHSLEGGFHTLEDRLGALQQSTDQRFDGLERRFDVLESGLSRLLELLGKDLPSPE